MDLIYKIIQHNHCSPKHSQHRACHKTNCTILNTIGKTRRDLLNDAYNPRLCNLSEQSKQIIKRTVFSV